MALVQYFSVNVIFLAVAFVSILAAATVFLVCETDLKQTECERPSTLNASTLSDVAGLFRIRGVWPLLIASGLFHLANAPAMPLVAQKIKFVGGSNTYVAAVVLVAQSVMVPVALATGHLGMRIESSLLLSFGFVVLPIRIALYPLTDDPALLVALQALDGIGVGIFDVAVVSYCAELTRGRGRFNTLMGALGLAVGVGVVVGPALSGSLVEHRGFTTAFDTFAGIAAAAAGVFIGWMPRDLRGTLRPNRSCPTKIVGAMVEVDQSDHP